MYIYLYNVNKMKFIILAYIEFVFFFYGFGDFRGLVDGVGIDDYLIRLF